MKQNAGGRVPRARTEGLVIQELPDEVLVYDRDRDKAHCLNQTAALVWKYCDGKNTVPGIAQKLQRDLETDSIDDKVVWFALGQLDKDHLLEETVVPPAVMAGMTRRELVRTLGVAAVVALPLVTSIIAPTPAQAATCKASGVACGAPNECCSGSCASTPATCPPTAVGLCC
jgi:Coenzyme PQQ synthesis protein D (PqqD)